MLLSSPSFSGFLDTLSQNPAAVQPAPAPAAVQQQTDNRVVRKDVNPYAAQQQMQQQQIGMAMIPEQTMDFSMLDLNTDGAYSYQPQVFSVLSLPETVIDSDILSGKTSSFSPLASEAEKIELPTVERAPESAPAKVEVAPIEEVADEEFDADPAFALYTNEPAATTVSKPQDLEDVLELLASIPAKESHFELVVESRVSEDEAEAAMRRVDRLCEGIERMADLLKTLTIDL
jgi:hypothetical protein